jgi:hypothetical protein
MRHSSHVYVIENPDFAFIQKIKKRERFCFLKKTKTKCFKAQFITINCVSNEKLFIFMIQRVYILHDQF